MADYDTQGKSFTPPWSRIQSLGEMTTAAGINFDEFIQCIKEGHEVIEMAQRFQVSPATIDSLQQHFFKYGIASVIGGD